jgi:hypothetical protein
MALALRQTSIAKASAVLASFLAARAIFALARSSLAGSRHQFAALKNVELSISDDKAREVIKGAQACAVWTTTDDDGDTCDHCELSSEAESEIADDCVSFIQSIPARELVDYAEIATPIDGSIWELLGFDFWLTRNGHGAGLWDRGYGELGEKLSEHARAAGGRDTLLNDETTEIEVY